MDEELYDGYLKFFTKMRAGVSLADLDIMNPRSGVSLTGRPAVGAALGVQDGAQAGVGVRSKAALVDAVNKLLVTTAE
jgi:hypothetical protein